MTSFYRIESAKDLPDAIKFASGEGAGSKFRWYVARMAKAYGKSDLIPGDWDVDVSSAAFRVRSEAELQQNSRVDEAVDALVDTADKVIEGEVDVEQAAQQAEAVMASAARAGIEVEVSRAWSNGLDVLVADGEITEEQHQALVAAVGKVAQKVVKKVRTLAGVKRYGAPIGTPIIADPKTGKLKADLTRVPKTDESKVAELKRRVEEASKALADAREGNTAARGYEARQKAVRNAENDMRKAESELRDLKPRDYSTDRMDTQQSKVVRTPAEDITEGDELQYKVSGGKATSRVVEKITPRDDGGFDLVVSDSEGRETKHTLPKGSQLRKVFDKDETPEHEQRGTSSDRLKRDIDGIKAEKQRAKAEGVDKTAHRDSLVDPDMAKSGTPSMSSHLPEHERAEVAKKVNEKAPKGTNLDDKTPIKRGEKAFGVKYTDADGNESEGVYWSDGPKGSQAWITVKDPETGRNAFRLVEEQNGKITEVKDGAPTRRLPSRQEAEAAQDLLDKSKEWVAYSSALQQVENIKSEFKSPNGTQYLRDRLARAEERAESLRPKGEQPDLEALEDAQNIVAYHAFAKAQMGSNQTKLGRNPSKAGLQKFAPNSEMTDDDTADMPSLFDEPAEAPKPKAEAPKPTPKVEASKPGPKAAESKPEPKPEPEKPALTQENRNEITDTREVDGVEERVRRSGTIERGNYLIVPTNDGNYQVMENFGTYRLSKPKFATEAKARNRVDRLTKQEADRKAKQDAERRTRDTPRAEQTATSVDTPDRDQTTQQSGSTGDSDVSADRLEAMRGLDESTLKEFRDSRAKAVERDKARIRPDSAEMSAHERGINDSYKQNVRRAEADIRAADRIMDERSSDPGTSPERSVTSDKPDAQGPEKADTPDTTDPWDADITIEHTPDGGTIVHGTEKGSPAVQVLKDNGFRWSRNLGSWYQPRTRDQRPDQAKIDRTAAALEKAGFSVGKAIDNDRRSAADREAAKAERADERAEALSNKADRKARDAEIADQRRKAADARVPEGGEPIKVGHHSEQRHRNAIEKSFKALGKSVEADREAKRAAERADTAARATDRRHSPDTVKNRISKLEADIRRDERALNGHTRNFRDGKGEIYSSDVTPPATGARKEQIEQRLADARDDLDYWKGIRDQQVAEGKTTNFSAEDFKPGQFVVSGSNVYRIKKVNKKTLTVETEGYQSGVRTAKVDIDKVRSAPSDPEAIRESLAKSVAKLSDEDLKSRVGYNRGVLSYGMRDAMKAELARREGKPAPDPEMPIPDLEQPKSKATPKAPSAPESTDADAPEVQGPPAEPDRPEAPKVDVDNFTMATPEEQGEDLTGQYAVKYRDDAGEWAEGTFWSPGPTDRTAWITQDTPSGRKFVLVDKDPRGSGLKKVPGGSEQMMAVNAKGNSAEGARGDKARTNFMDKFISRGTEKQRKAVAEANAIQTPARGDRSAEVERDPRAIVGVEGKSYRPISQSFSLDPSDTGALLKTPNGWGTVKSVTTKGNGQKSVEVDLLDGGTWKGKPVSGAPMRAPHLIYNRTTGSEHHVTADEARMIAEVEKDRLGKDGLFDEFRDMQATQRIQSIINGNGDPGKQDKSARVKSLVDRVQSTTSADVAKPIGDTRTVAEWNAAGDLTAYSRVQLPTGEVLERGSAGSRSISGNGVYRHVVRNPEETLYLDRASNSLSGRQTGGQIIAIRGEDAVEVRPRSVKVTGTDVATGKTVTFSMKKDGGQVNVLKPIVYTSGPRKGEPMSREDIERIDETDRMVWRAGEANLNPEEDRVLRSYLQDERKRVADEVNANPSGPAQRVTTATPATSTDADRERQAALGRTLGREDADELIRETQQHVMGDRSQAPKSEPTVSNLDLSRAETTVVAPGAGTSVPRNAPAAERARATTVTPPAEKTAAPKPKPTASAPAAPVEEAPAPATTGGPLRDADGDPVEVGSEGFRLGQGYQRWRVSKVNDNGTVDLEPVGEGRRNRIGVDPSRLKKYDASAPANRSVEATPTLTTASDAGLYTVGRGGKKWRIASVNTDGTVNLVGESGEGRQRWSVARSKLREVSSQAPRGAATGGSLGTDSLGNEVSRDKTYRLGRGSQVWRVDKVNEDGTLDLAPVGGDRSRKRLAVDPARLKATDAPAPKRGRPRKDRSAETATMRERLDSIKARAETRKSDVDTQAKKTDKAVKDMLNPDTPSADTSNVLTDRVFNALSGVHRRKIAALEGKANLTEDERNELSSSRASLNRLRAEYGLAPVADPKG